MRDKYIGERIRARITISSSENYQNKPLYIAIIDMLEKNQIFGATVFRGVGGFGEHGHFHTDRFLSLSSHLPIVIEFVDFEERVRSLLPDFDKMISKGMITLEPVEVVFYRHH